MRRGTESSAHCLDTVVNISTAFIYKSNCRRYCRGERLDRHRSRGQPEGVLLQQSSPADHGQGFQHESLRRQGLLLLPAACHLSISR